MQFACRCRCILISIWSDLWHIKSLYQHYNFSMTVSIVLNKPNMINIYFHCNVCGFTKAVYFFFSCSLQQKKNIKTILWCRLRLCLKVLRPHWVNNWHLIPMRSHLRGHNTEIRGNLCSNNIVCVRILENEWCDNVSVKVNSNFNHFFFVIHLFLVCMFVSVCHESTWSITVFYDVNLMY